MVLLALLEGAGLGLRGLLLFQLTLRGSRLRRASGSGGNPEALRWELSQPSFLSPIPTSRRWHAYVLTESIYISMVVLTTWTVYRAWTRRGIWYAAAVGTAALAAAVRPTGWLLLPIVAGCTG